MATPVYPPSRRLDPRHGTHDPVTSTPDRRPGSVRRTTTIDMVRPEGISSDLRLSGRARDLRTAADGSVAVLDEATMEVVIDYLDAAAVRTIVTTPAVEGLDRLVGRSASTGFRAAMDDVVGSQSVR